MLIHRSNDHQPSEITPRDLYQRRRDWLKLVAAGSIAGLSGTLAACTPKADEPDTTLGLRKLTGVNKSALSTAEPVNTYKHVTTYNNYYEFGIDKSDPAAYAKQLRVQPWTVIVEGEVAKPRSFGIEDLLQLPVEERVYRLRCVEAWSMVIPWIG
ncbi:MAG: molybdopterin-dependent oxidoreductase, partial [Chitinophagaceae bacterium]|nr:molybdopterin-dependent oxidoreductase [Rubrivivax sp.]